VYIKLQDLISRHNLKIHGVIHLGAHNAEELEDYTACGISRTVWVEANPNKIIGLLNRVLAIPGHSVFCFAAHETDGLWLKLNVANNGESSSIFELHEHKELYPHIEMVESVSVPTRRVDSLFKQNGLDASAFNFVNVDIQGAELLALKGMSNMLDSIDYIYAEINIGELYKGCCKVEEIDEYLSKFNFSRVETKLADHHGTWGDALYIKENNR
jgi:FkbM family methyltransferase